MGIMKWLFGNTARDNERQYLQELEHKYRCQKEINSHWLTKYVFIVDELRGGALPAYEKDNPFAVILNEHCDPGLSCYPSRVWVPMILVTKLHKHFEEKVILALHLAGTIENRKYNNIEDVEYY